MCPAWIGVWEEEGKPPSKESELRGQPFLKTAESSPFLLICPNLCGTQESKVTLMDVRKSGVQGVAQDRLMDSDC